MKKKTSYITINIISVVVPLLVAILLGIRKKLDIGTWTTSLTLVNACINSATALLLIYGLVLIRQGKIAKHKRVMSSAFVLGGVFLAFYILYHISNASTQYGGTGFLKYVYYFVLITHILLSFVVLPLVLRAYYFGWKRMDIEHKKVVKFAFPIWLYVSISGVVAYLMISPYYLH